MNHASKEKGKLSESEQHSALTAFADLLARLCARKHWQDSIKREPPVRDKGHDAVDMEDSQIRRSDN